MHGRCSILPQPLMSYFLIFYHSCTLFRATEHKGNLQLIPSIRPLQFLLFLPVLCIHASLFCVLSFGQDPYRGRKTGMSPQQTSLWGGPGVRERSGRHGGEANSLNGATLSWPQVLQALWGAFVVHVEVQWLVSLAVVHYGLLISVECQCTHLVWNLLEREGGKERERERGGD